MNSGRLAIVVLLLLPVSGAAQTVQEPRDFAAWRRAVESHAAARRDAAVVDLARWEYGDLLAVLAEVGRLELPERATVVRKGLLLHTDIAIAYRTALGYNLPLHGRGSTLFADGRSIGGGSATYHWDFARSLLARLPAGAERTEIARLFYRTTGAVMQQWSAHTELDAHLAAGLRLLDNDPVLLLYQGTRHQIYAHPRAQAAFDERRRQAGARMGRSTGVFIQDRRSTILERVSAEQDFRRALEIDPSLHEARIRLAHVLADRGRYADALEHLGRVPVREISPMLGFYLHLVTGRAERALDRLEEAKASFESARLIVPAAQAPRLALSEVSLALGDHAAALDYLTDLPAEQGSFEDQWSLLARTHDGAETMLTEMREAF
jgi:tetratricopeptide (TPR) repeat protein